MKNKQVWSPPLLILLVAVSGVLLWNQVELNSFPSARASPVESSGASLGEVSERDLSEVVVEPKSTAHTIAAVFPVDEMAAPEQAMTVMFPTGTPEYGPQLGVSFDTPVESLAVLARMYPSLKEEVKKSHPERFERFLNLVTNPYSISCEFCCGVGPSAVNSEGDSICGCQHNPALLSIAAYLTAYSEYSDAEILREVMRWKTLFFPKNMVEIGVRLAGGDESVLELPGMVGGC